MSCFPERCSGSGPTIWTAPCDPGRVLFFAPGSQGRKTHTPIALPAMRVTLPGQQTPNVPSKSQPTSGLGPICYCVEFIQADIGFTSKCFSFPPLTSKINNRTGTHNLAQYSIIRLTPSVIIC